MNWEDIVAELIKSLTGKYWRDSYFPGERVMDLRDGSWLALNEHFLRFAPGTTKKLEGHWFPNVAPEVVVQHLAALLGKGTIDA